MSDERLPWFPCEQTKLLAALAQMQPSEGYVYCIMLLRIYECGGACPDDLAAIATRTRFSRRITADALDRLFKAGRLVRESDGIHNPKADGVIAVAQGLREKRKVAGEKGSDVRWKKTEQNQRSVNSKPTDLPLANDGYLHLHLQEDKKDTEANASAVSPTHAELERQLFQRGKAVLGKNSGGMITALLKSREFDVALARSAIETAATKQDPREYIAAAIKGGPDGRNRVGGFAGSGARQGGGFASYAVAHARAAGEKDG